MNAKRLLSYLIVSILGGVVALLIYSSVARPKVILQEAPQKVSQFVNNSSPLNLDFTQAAELTVHAVVHVKTKYAGRNDNQLFDYLFGGNSRSMASGSGVIISTDGYIVTNNHVIDNSDDIEVILNDRRSFKARLIGKDPNTDVALIKIDATNLPTIPYGNSDNLKVGEWVLAIGNPFNLTSTVTAGIVSAKGRNINILENQRAIESFIQTDAAVNPGNSGGALVNIKGELVGINTAIASQTGSYTGYSFAIPVGIVQKIVADLMEFGTVQRVYLGIVPKEVDLIAKEKNIEKIEGVYIETVSEGGSAYNAGIKDGDIILKIGSISVNKTSELREQVAKYRPGDKTVVTVKRDNKILEFNVVFTNESGSTKIEKKNEKMLLGAYFTPINQEDKRELGIDHGLKITKLESGKFLKAGIKEGFIITYINRTPVNSIEDIKKILNSTKGGVYIEGVYPDGFIAYYAFGLK